MMCLAGSIALSAQGTLAPLNEDYYHLTDRYEVKNGTLSPYFHTSLKGYERPAIAAFADSMLMHGADLSAADRFNLQYLINDNWEWTDSADNDSKKPFLKHFYKVQSDLYYVREKAFDLHINPVLHLSGGVESASEVNTMINTRGVEVRGIIDGKVGFYSYLGENQIVNPQYVRDYRQAAIIVPHEGFWKGFKEDGVDFFTARGYITFRATRHIALQFGHDRFKVGNGYRSLILSDFAPAYLFLKVNTRVWKINYTNIFSNMTADVTGNADGLTASGRYPEKYMAFHHLGINIGKRLNIGVFESVIFDRQDSLSNNSFDLRYANPIIFYRAIEQQNGSADNVLLGLDFKWLAGSRISVYGQLVLDEFLLDNLKEGSGWWGNKYAAQLGAEYIDAFGVDNLDVQAEANLARPYTYSHSSAYGSYSHYLQPLAHPRGANFDEFIGILRYQPFGRLMLSGKLIYSRFGTDGEGENFGGDILLNNRNRVRDFGNETGQGVANNLLFMDLTASYQWKHNFFLEVKHVFRDLQNEGVGNASTHFTSLGVRWNVPQRLHEF